MEHRSLDDLYPSMPWDELDAVVFDVGNVLISFDPEKILREIFPEQEDLRETLAWKVFRSPYWIMLDRGSISREDAMQGMAGFDKALLPAIQKLMDEWLDLKEVLPEGVDALHACKERGKKTYVLSNYSQDGFDFIAHKYPFFQLFDGMVVSAREGLLKPDQAIYRLLLSRYGLAPERTLFIDDAPANIEGALEAGMRGFCLNRPGRLSAFLS